MRVPQYLYADNEEMQRVVALLLQQCQSDLSDNGWQVPQLSANDVIRITSGGVNPLIPAFLPVMRGGTLWFNTNLKKLQFITDKAIPDGQIGGPLDAVIETVTSA